jgi:Fur family ferric uptake transcriptional regulator
MNCARSAVLDTGCSTQGARYRVHDPLDKTTEEFKNSNRYYNQYRPIDLRKTEQRIAILEEIRLCRNHPSADEVYQRVRRRVPRISLGTVYRNLELMASQGIIRCFATSSGQKRFDPVTKQHCHFRCKICGKIEDIPFAVRFPRLDPDHPWVQEREIQGARPEYFGICPDCLGK